MPVSGQTIGTAGVDANIMYNGVALLTFDFTGSTLVVTHPFDGGNVGFGGSASDSSVNSVTFTSSMPFEFASLLSATTGSGFTTPNITGFSSNNLSVNSGALTINFGGSMWANRAVAVISLAAPESLPEPATWAMMLLGFGGIGFHLRRKRAGNTKHLIQLA